MTKEISVIGTIFTNTYGNKILQLANYKNDLGHPSTNATMMSYKTAGTTLPYHYDDAIKKVYKVLKELNVTNYYIYDSYNNEWLN